MPLLERGIALCAQWEQLAERQFTALKEKDLQAFSVVHFSQLHLADQLYDLELRWREIIGKFQGQAAGGGTEDAETMLPRDLRVKRYEFLAAAQRASSFNFRNAKALAASMLLQAAYEPLTTTRDEQTYDRSGRSKISQRLVAMALDREG